jgi:hypothetical protein
VIYLLLFITIFSSFDGKSIVCIDFAHSDFFFAFLRLYVCVYRIFCIIKKLQNTKKKSDNVKSTAKTNIFFHFQNVCYKIKSCNKNYLEICITILCSSLTSASIIEHFISVGLVNQRLVIK